MEYDIIVDKLTAHNLILLRTCEAKAEGRSPTETVQRAESERDGGELKRAAATDGRSVEVSQTKIVGNQRAGN